MRKQGIKLEGMEFKEGNTHYRIGSMYGMPERGRGNVNKCALFVNGVNIGLIEVTELITRFKIKI